MMKWAWLLISQLPRMRVIFGIKISQLKLNKILQSFSDTWLYFHITNIPHCFWNGWTLLKKNKKTFKAYSASEDLIYADMFFGGVDNAIKKLFNFIWKRKALNTQLYA